MIVTKEQLLKYINDRHYNPLKYKLLAERFGANSKQDFTEFLKLLTELSEELLIIIYKEVVHSINGPDFAIAQMVAKKNTKSFFETGEESIAVSNYKLRDAIYLDQVLLGSYGKNEFVVLEVLKRNLKTFVGEYISTKFNHIRPDNDNIDSVVILEDLEEPLQIGSKVEVVIKKIVNQRIYVKLVKVLGHKNDVGVDILSKLIDRQIPYQFSEETLKEASIFQDDIKPTDFVNRQDLTKELIFTIDGEDAKDLDDAISISLYPNGNYRVLISIADVSYYVTRKSFLDKEAYERGTSIYLVGKVIPMLPPNLSNGICSLHPQVNRLAITCEAEINNQGKVVFYQIYPSVINSKYRLTYDEVNEFLTSGNIQYSDKLLHQALSSAAAVAKLLSRNRYQRGAINLVTNEAKFIVDENGKIKEIVKRKQLAAENLIEELMILANEIVATHLTSLNLPTIYRIHEPPSVVKTENLLYMLKNFRYSIQGKKGKTLNSRQYQAILEYYKDKPEELVLNNLILRSFAKAKYSHQNLGHFGLASVCYTHFTSPIRRYPDLLIHRLLREYLFEANFNAKKWNSQIQMIVDIAEQSSEMERRAISLEREVEDMKKAEYMAQFINERYQAVISSLTSFGMFVELENTVQGLIRFSNMDGDFYQFDEERLMVYGNYSKKVFRIGDKINVQLVSVDIIKGEINFILVKK